MSDVDRSRQRVLGACLMVVCAMSYAVMSAATHSSGKYVPSGEIALVRFSFQILVCVIWFFLGCPKSQGLNVPWLAIRGISGACAIMLLFYGLTLVPVGDGIALYSLYPIWSSLIAWRYLGEPFGAWLACSLFLCVGGTALITLGERHPNNSSSAQDIPASQTWTTNQAHGYVAIVAGSVFASMEFISCRMLTDANAIFLTMSVSVMGALASVTKLAYDGDAVSFASIPFEGIVSLVGVCMSGFIAVQLLNSSAQLLEAGPVTIIGASEIVWAYLLQIWIFHDVPTLIVTIGAVFVLVGAMLPGLQRIEGKRTRDMSQGLLIDSRHT